MDLNSVEIKMKERIDYLKEELSSIRAGRANPQILNKITVEYYGMPSPLNQVASISVPEPRQILIAPWDKNLLGEISKAISKSDIGINPMNDGNAIRLTFPELNEARRKELAKEVSKMGEDTKVQIRNIRRDAIDDVKKEQKELNTSEDEVRSLEEQIQKITDKQIDTVTVVVSEKEKEIMEI